MKLPYVAFCCFSNATSRLFKIPFITSIISMKRTNIIKSKYPFSTSGSLEKNSPRGFLTSNKMIKKIPKQSKAKTDEIIAVTFAFPISPSPIAFPTKVHVEGPSPEAILYINPAEQYKMQILIATYTLPR